MQSVKGKTVVVTGKASSPLWPPRPRLVALSLCRNAPSRPLQPYKAGPNQSPRPPCSGASHGIGAAIACAFAREGAKLHLVASPSSKDETKEMSSKCGGMGAESCDCHECDLADPKACDAICSKIGDTDVLINNAGVFGPSGEEQGPLKGDPNAWDEVVKINLLAPMRMTRAFAPKMKGKSMVLQIKVFSLGLGV